MSTLVTHGLGQDVGNIVVDPEEEPLSLDFGWSAEAVGTRIVLGVGNFSPTLFMGSTGDPFLGLSGTYNFTTHQCSTINMALRLQRSDGSAFDPYGASATFTIRRRVSSENYVVQLTTNPLSDFKFMQESGDLLLHIGSTVTGSLIGNNVYSLDITNADGSVNRVLTGLFYVHDSATGLVFV